MIKLITSDLDGTLLLSGGVLPPETFTLIRKLKEKGILFCPASGRQYESVKRLFAPVADDVIFIAENGGLVYYQNKRLFSAPMPTNVVDFALDVIRNTAGVFPLVCCENNAYAEDDYPPFLAECLKYYPHFVHLTTLDNLPEKNQVYKIAVYDDKGSTVSGKALADLMPDLRVIVSGKVWTDVSMPAVNKGIALNFIQNYFHFTKDECMGFGDYMNDLELLLACTQAFVTQNGYPLLQEKIGNVIPSCFDKGVIRKICQEFNVIL